MYKTLLRMNTNHSLKLFCNDCSIEAELFPISWGIWTLWYSWSRFINL